MGIMTAPSAESSRENGSRKTPCCLPSFSKLTVGVIGEALTMRPIQPFSGDTDDYLPAPGRFMLSSDNAILFIGLQGESA
jgi:hypothetical protein